MATSKELLEILRILSEIPEDEKKDLLILLRSRQDSADTSPPLSSSLEKDAV